MFDEWSEKDPVELSAARMTEAGLADADEIAATKDEVRQVAIDARTKVLADPMPEGDDVAAGAALKGLRPVVEFQFADFISAAFDQIINVVARHHYRTGDAMPITFRCPFGARLRAGLSEAAAGEAMLTYTGRSLHG
jgi:hypothetical protein